MSWVEKKRKN